MNHYKIFNSSLVVYFIAIILNIFIHKGNFLHPVLTAIETISGLVMIYYVGFVTGKFLKMFHDSESEEN
jgi:hypothetical protein